MEELSLQARSSGEGEPVECEEGGRLSSGRPEAYKWAVSSCLWGEDLVWEKSPEGALHVVSSLVSHLLLWL